jgi:hypothetical protein
MPKRTNWSHDRLKDLLVGTDGSVVAYFECPADGEAALFAVDGRLWYYDTAPGCGWEQRAPEVVDDTLGIGWGADIGTDPSIRPIEEAPNSVGCLVERVRAGEEHHAWDEFREAFG